MKVALFSRDRVNHKSEEIKQIFACLDSHNLDFCINEEFAPIVEKILDRQIPATLIYGKSLCTGTEQLPEGSVMLCYGGDGTILEGLYRLHGQRLPVVGINSGRLGFLASGTGADIEQIFEEIASKTLCVEQRDMICVEGDFAPDGQPLFAANELSVQRLGASMIEVETMVDGHPVATYYGDGVIISTPTGSTAYSLSVGGPIIAPNCACFVLSPVAPHNLTMRPVVVPSSSTISMSIQTRQGDAAISLDNRTYPIGQRAKVTVKLSKNHFLLATAKGTSFYETLRKKMMWGVDSREMQKK